MGRLNRGPNGPFSGKAGSIIGSSWRGIFYIKGLQKKTTKPRSPGQIEQQDRFAFAVKFLSPVKELLKKGFDSVNPYGATGYNMAISHFLHNSIKGTYPDLEIDYPSVAFTKGKLLPPETANVELEGDSLKVSWSTETDDRKAFTDDRVHVLVYVPGSNFFLTPAASMRSQAGTELELLNEGYKGETVYIYLYLVDREGKKWSNSLYVGSVVVEEHQL